MQKFEQILEDIRLLKIQGAENIAKEGVKSLLLILKRSKAHSSEHLLEELLKARDKIISTRPTEPAMRNALNYIFSIKEIPHNPAELSAIIKDKVAFAVDYFEQGQKEIITCGTNKIKKGYVVFTHCHSSTVVNILLEAKKKGIDFEVHNTETRPKFQGRKTAAELAKAGIPVYHYVDSAAMVAMKKADICLFGADAVQSDGKVLNKIGTGLFAEVARKHDIPVFCCMNSWKFDPSTVGGFDEVIEERDASELWTDAPKKVKIRNPAFEVVDPERITGIISEFGIYPPSAFIDLVLRKHPWMLKKYH